MPQVRRISRPVLLTFLIAFAILSLFILYPHPYNPLRSDPAFIPPEVHEVPENRPVEHSPPAIPELPPLPGHENATLLMLTSSWEMEGALRVVSEVEERFNRKFNYPWIFLNDEPFSEEFQHRMSSLVSGPVHFAGIPDELWNPPPWINETKMAERMIQMEIDGIAKSGRLGYHNMCRFYSGMFYHHPLLQNYRYYWRVEPEAQYHCDVDYDPFTVLRENNKIYGFVLTLPEESKSIEALWPTVKEFIAEHPQYIIADNAMDFLSDNGGNDYNNCLFFNNFEIADMDFWRGEAYTAFFNYLDRNGGFYYQRWGDAPVHTIGASLFGAKDGVHFFREIGYEHYPFVHCPQDDMWQRGRCSCEQDRNFDYHGGWSCLPKWEQALNERQGH